MKYIKNGQTTLFLDYAEDMANEHNLMAMQKWIDATDDLIKFRKKKILSNSGNISHKQALEKANEEDATELSDKYKKIIVTLEPDVTILKYVPPI